MYVKLELTSTTHEVNWKVHGKSSDSRPHPKNISASRGARKPTAFNTIETKFESSIPNGLMTAYGDAIAINQHI